MPSANTTEALDNLTLAIQGIDATFFLLVLMAISVALTWALFQSRQAMLGFPCGIFWAILGGYAYTQTASFFPPTDIYAFLGIASLLGMTPFTIFAAYGLRTKKEELAEGDEFIDEGKDDIKFIDEGGKDKDTEPESDEEKPRRVSRSIRERASRRRERWD